MPFRTFLALLTDSYFPSFRCKCCMVFACCLVSSLSTSTSCSSTEILSNPLSSGKPPTSVTDTRSGVEGDRGGTGGGGLGGTALSTSSTPFKPERQTSDNVKGNALVCDGGRVSMNSDTSSLLTLLAGTSTVVITSASKGEMTYNSSLSSKVHGFTEVYPLCKPLMVHHYFQQKQG